MKFVVPFKLNWILYCIACRTEVTTLCLITRYIAVKIAVCLGPVLNNLQIKLNVKYIFELQILQYSIQLTYKCTEKYGESQQLSSAENLQALDVLVQFQFYRRMFLKLHIIPKYFLNKTQSMLTAELNASCSFDKLPFGSFLCGYMTWRNCDALWFLLSQKMAQWSRYFSNCSRISWNDNY